ncbi:MAG: hypothetical protein IJZ93_05075 [Clostridia bacterium]|nr:hypothetical protein [Clostridia bacterium]
MKKDYKFMFLDKSKINDILPLLFDLLFENMKDIAFFEDGYDKAKNDFLKRVSPAMSKENRQIVLFYSENDLAGYAQYYINDTTFMVEEIQLKSQHKRTMLLYQFCKFMKNIVPKSTLYIEAFTDKRNINSQNLIKSFGMKIIDDKNEKFYHFIGDFKKLSCSFK